MDINQFWQLIDQARIASYGYVDEQANLLIEKLMNLPLEEILAFDRLFQILLARADHDNLIDVAFVIGNYISDSGWEDFRGWLIGQGQTVYENALNDPETLADVVAYQAREEIFGERLLYAAYIAYQNKAGEPPPPAFITDERLTDEPLSKCSPRIAASNHNDFNQQFKAKYPKVWEKFKDGHEL